MTIEELEKIARAATPGPWKVNTGFNPVCSLGNSNLDNEDYEVNSNQWDIEADAKHDATHIATFSPTRVLALLDALREAREGLKFYADEETYEERRADPYGPDDEWNPGYKPIEEDEGKAARAALQKIEEKLGV